jgi:hypothetical protein
MSYNSISNGFYAYNLSSLKISALKTFLAIAYRANAAKLFP